MERQPKKTATKATTHCNSMSYRSSTRPDQPLARRLHLILSEAGGITWQEQEENGNAAFSATDVVRFGCSHRHHACFAAANSKNEPVLMANQWERKPNARGMIMNQYLIHLCDQQRRGEQRDSLPMAHPELGQSLAGAGLCLTVNVLRRQREEAPRPTAGKQV